MHNAMFFGTFDVTSLILSVFTLFFVGLIIHLRREDRREGYPLEQEVSGNLEPNGGLLFTAKPKTFVLPNGQGTVTKPNSHRESPLFKARRTSRAAGSPLVPEGDPMLAGVGPGAYAQRAKRPDLTFHGDPRIVPLRADSTFVIDVKVSDPLGMKVVGVDGAVGGTVKDIWVDRSESIVRYLEVAVASGRTALLPITLSVVDNARRTVKVWSITGAQFAGVPALASPDQVTLDEEERIVAYYGGGLLYATAGRAEPWL